MNLLETILDRANRQKLPEVTVAIPEKNQTAADHARIVETAARFGFEAFPTRQHVLFRKPITTAPQS